MERPPQLQIGNKVRIMSTLTTERSSYAEHVNKRGIVMTIHEETPNIEAFARVMLDTVVIAVPISCLMRIAP